MIRSTVRRAALPALLLQLACRSSARHARRPAFAIPPGRGARPPPPLFSTVVDAAIESEPEVDVGDDPDPVLRARDELLALAAELASDSPSGKFITRPSDRVKLQDAINGLEALADLPGEREKGLLLGDWTLVATAGLPSSDIRRRLGGNDRGKGGGPKRGGWFKPNPIQKSIQKTFGVTQRIRSDGVDGSEPGEDVSRVDNVIELTPPDTLEDIIPEDSPLFGLLGTVDVNPLKVKKSKLALVHKAEVESTEPLRTKIAFVSTVVNVAGTSQFLDPDGADVFGINNLLGEFGNVGTFDTPYVDEDVRVSRTSGPVLEQLRVFVRQGSSLLDEGAEKEAAKSEGVDVRTRVGEVAGMAENARSTIEKDMEPVAKALGDAMDDVAARVQDAVEDDLEKIGKAVEGVQSAIQGDGGGVGEAVSSVAEAVAKVPGDVQGIVEESATGLADEVAGALDAMAADVQDSVEKDLEEMGKTIEESSDPSEGSEDGVEAEEK